MWRPSGAQPLLPPGKGLLIYLTAKFVYVLGFGSWLCKNGKVTTDLGGRTLDPETHTHAHTHALDQSANEPIFCSLMSSECRD